VSRRKRSTGSWLPDEEVSVVQGPSAGRKKVFIDKCLTLPTLEGLSTCAVSERDTR
jgi:hypothetical protein